MKSRVRIAALVFAALLSACSDQPEERVSLLVAVDSLLARISRDGDMYASARDPAGQPAYVLLSKAQRFGSRALALTTQAGDEDIPLTLLDENGDGVPEYAMASGESEHLVLVVKIELEVLPAAREAELKRWFADIVYQFYGFTEGGSDFTTSEPVPITST
jgi:hypothetical protein